MSETLAGQGHAQAGFPFHYRAHGLDLSSEVELPEAITRAPGPPDVVIRYGQVPETIGRAIASGSRHRFAPQECLLHFPGVARYWVRSGREVVVAPEAGATVEDLRVYILSVVMGTLVHQNGFFPLHASAVEIGGECVLFTGVSGAGKSTLAAACYTRGHTVYTDDLSAISFHEDGRPLVHPGYRILKLSVDTIARLGPQLGELRALTSRVGKRHVALPSSSTAKPLPIRAIFAIAAAGQAYAPLQGADKVRLLLKETYRRRLLHGLGQQAHHFTLATRIARDTPVNLLPRPAGLAGVLELVDQLGNLAPAPRRNS